MEELERQYLISYYDKRVGILGETPAALGWSPKGQRARYEAALELFGPADLEGASLADYGCGMGDFYGFLAEKVIRADYRGFDINPGLVEIARRRYPGASFGVLDVDESRLPRDCDFALICGVFNQRIEGAAAAARRCVERIWGQTKRALVFDVLSGDSSDTPDISLHYWSPRDLFDFGVTLPGASASVVESLTGGGLILCLRREQCTDS
ncbi:MAG: class I SAM-dependent methyltransferase [Nitrospiraceae bacterium]|nr:class I SAM-dependent methyltransferase [Nitrospiraceae bacterium]